MEWKVDRLKQPNETKGTTVERPIQLFSTFSAETELFYDKTFPVFLGKTRSIHKFSLYMVLIEIFLILPFNTPY